MTNDDAHLKNFCVIYDDVTGATRLAPVYGDAISRFRLLRRLSRKQPTCCQDPLPTSTDIQGLRREPARSARDPSVGGKRASVIASALLATPSSPSASQAFRRRPDALASETLVRFAVSDFYHVKRVPFARPALILYPQQLRERHRSEIGPG